MDEIWFIDEALDDAEWGEDEEVDEEFDEDEDYVEEEDNYHYEDEREYRGKCCDCIHCIPIGFGRNKCLKYPPPYQGDGNYWYSNVERPACENYHKINKEQILGELLEPMSGVTHEMLRL